MPSYTEQDMQDALNRLHQGPGSIRKVARDFGIPASTLRCRIKGSLPRKEAFETHQLIPRDQEDKLVQWVSTQAALALPPSRAQIKEFVARMLEAEGHSRSVGKGWVKRFFRRNPMVLALLEKNNKPDDQGLQPHTPGPSAPTQPAVVASEVLFTTPRKRKDLRTSLTDLGTHFKDQGTKRLLIRKVEKAFDEKNFEVARLRQENEALKAQIEALKSSKRKRVRVDPNPQFTTIQQIHRAQMEASRIDASSIEESGSENAESEASCIVVQSKRG
ncbi:hypothetical protein VTI74DRAFT_2833 [Chaetomium olivicolor]